MIRFNTPGVCYLVSRVLFLCVSSDNLLSVSYNNKQVIKLAQCLLNVALERTLDDRASTSPRMDWPRPLKSSVKNVAQSRAVATSLLLSSCGDE